MLVHTKGSRSPTHLNSVCARGEASQFETINMQLERQRGARQCVATLAVIT